MSSPRRNRCSWRSCDCRRSAGNRLAWRRAHAARPKRPSDRVEALGRRDGARRSRHHRGLRAPQPYGARRARDRRSRLQRRHLGDPCRARDRRLCRSGRASIRAPTFASRRSSPDSCAQVLRGRRSGLCLPARRRRIPEGSVAGAARSAPGAAAAGRACDPVLANVRPRFCPRLPTFSRCCAVRVARRRRSPRSTRPSCRGIFCTARP